MDRFWRQWRQVNALVTRKLGEYTVRQENILRTLGVTPVINAAGTFTYLGGSIMAAEVRESWLAASHDFVDLSVLQNQIGQRIATRLGVEAAMITGGAACGILLGTAAAITVREPAFLHANVVAADGRPFEVLRQVAHRDPYDRQIECCGVNIVEVATLADLERCINDRTVMMMSYNLYERESTIDQATWLRVAANRSIPTFLDAAADVPPVENLWRYCRMGFDLVTFSGSKAIGGPQSSGLLLGRHRLIEAAKRNAPPHEGTVGRVCKVGKEDMVAMWKALEIFTSDTPASGGQIEERCRAELVTVAQQLGGIATLEHVLITPFMANAFPHLRLKWDESQLGLTAEQVADQLRAGEPPIVTDRVYGTGHRGLLISAINLKEGEAEIVGARIAKILRGEQRRSS